MSELEEAHRRIADLERENERLKRRLAGDARSRSQTGKTFALLAMIIFALSLVAGMIYARLVRARQPPEPSHWATPG
jgi:hypothetical protein